MSIHIALNHVTHYRYDRLVHLGPQILRLRPAPHCRTRILSYSLRVTPTEHFINWQQDPQANFLARLVFPERTRELRIEIDLLAEMATINPFDFFLEPGAEQFPFAYAPESAHELAPFRLAEPAGPRLTAWLASVPRTPRPTIEFLVELNQRVQRETRYLIRLEPGVQAPEDTLARAAGSCRDSAWLLVQILRHLGLAARFASGYLVQLVPDVKPLDGPSGPPA
ncbi:MAG: transglutaminase N-terminal domain-containing protein, partial [Gammaproteobacteria bacterium]